MTGGYDSNESRYRSRIPNLCGHRRIHMLGVYAFPMHCVLMNFQCNRGWSVHFIEADCRTPVAPGCFYAYAELAQVREILVRANATPEVFAEFDHNIRAWSRGSVYLDLTEMQYSKLKDSSRSRRA